MPRPRLGAHVVRPIGAKAVLDMFFGPKTSKKTPNMAVLARIDPDSFKKRGEW
jgi:hypothetical protein